MRAHGFFSAKRKALSRFGVGFLLLFFLLGSFLPSFVQAAPQGANALHVVISEFRTRGANGGYDEFIELYNPTGSSVDISSWQIWGSNASGSTGLRVTIPTSTNLASGQHYLIANTHSGGYSGSYDLAYTTGITDDGGIALVLADGNTVVDAVGMDGNSAYLEGIPLSPLTSSVNQSYERNFGGNSGNCEDTDDNTSDFFVSNPSNPQTLSSPLVGCGTGAPDVIINEIAWAGTDAYFGDEWLELYNPSTTQTISLDGWVLSNESGSFYISFDSTDQISPDSYFLIERGSGNATSAVEDKTYTGGELDDAGETLYLYDDTRQTIDTANANNTAWSHGRLSPASSMERMSTDPDSTDNWVTNDEPHPTIVDAAGNPIYGTPGEKNWGYDVTPTPTPTNTFTPIPTNTPIPSATPTTPASLTVIINEVAWGGTNASSSHEWIELYNPSPTTPVDLSGWRLTDSGDIDIALSGTIQADGYFLLEQTENTVNDIQSDLLYNGTLSNSGEYLKLISPSGTTVDTANNDSGAWPAGTGSPNYASMERRGVVVDSSSAWLTHAGTGNGTDADGDPINGTPRQPNWAYNVTPTVAPTRTNTPIPPTRTPTPYPYQSVVLNEVLPRPGHDWNLDGVVNTNDEFIEIINRGVSTVSLSGWYIEDIETSYRLPNVNLGAGQRIAIYGYTSQISLSDGGDTVRLRKSNGQIADALTYTVVKAADHSWCRLPENGFWNTECFPTPNEENAGIGAFPPASADAVRNSCFVPDTAPPEILAVECGLLGMQVYDAEFWDEDNVPDYWIAGQTKFSVWFR